MKRKYVFSMGLLLLAFQLCAACDSLPAMPRTFDLATLTDSTRFRPEFESIPNVYGFSIFDSRGEEVFSTDIPEQGWNGLRRNRKGNCANGVYVWRIACSWTGDSVNVICSGEVTCLNMSSPVHVTALDTLACQLTVFVPSTFTPNGDGPNDVFIPFFGCTPLDYTMWVFDRWGNVVFESRDPFKGWDGGNGNRNAPVDTYVWKLKFGFYEGDKERQLIGKVMLIR